MVKQAIKKKEGIKKSLSSFKEKLGLGSKDNVKLEVSNADKPMEWIEMPQAYKNATKLYGVPCGYCVTICGHSNTGKSTFVNHALVQAQKMGKIPVIYDTENNFDWRYAIDMGLKAEPVYGDVEVEHIDEETGEITYTVESQIVNYEGEFIYFNNTILAERYGNMDYSSGKPTKTKRKVAVIEDVAASINELMRAQDDGEIEQGFLFVWDSIGSINCYRSYASLTNNNQWNAGAISQAFGEIINNRIPASRKMSSNYTNTLLLVNKVWLDSTTNPIAPPSLTLKGGSTALYGSRLLILLGGQLKSSTKRLCATSKGAQYNYGIETKIKVLKNQLPCPFNVSYEGNLICTQKGFISPDDLDGYKKREMTHILKELNSKIENKDDIIKEEDVQFSEEEGEFDD